jgi:hypothetical protein
LHRLRLRPGPFQPAGVTSYCPACTSCSWILAHATKSCRLWFSSSLTARPRKVLACKWGSRLEERVCFVLPSLRAGLSWRDPSDVMRVNLRPRWHGVHAQRYRLCTYNDILHPRAGFRTPVLYCCLLAAATAREADDRFSAATPATGKLQPPGGPKHGMSRAASSSYSTMMSACMRAVQR